MRPVLKEVQVLAGWMKMTMVLNRSALCLHVPTFTGHIGSSVIDTDTINHGYWAKACKHVLCNTSSQSHRNSSVKVTTALNTSGSCSPQQFTSAWQEHFLNYYIVIVVSRILLHLFITAHWMSHVLIYEILLHNCKSVYSPIPLFYLLNGNLSVHFLLL